MPKINVYLPDDLAEAVREAGVPVSAVCQRALELAVRRVTAIREIVTGTPSAVGTSDPPVLTFTRRVLGMLRSAQATAQAAGLDATGTEQLLSAIASDDDSLALRVLSALEITSRQLRSALISRGVAAEPAGPLAMGAVAAAAGPAFDPQAAAALQLAVVESSGLGNTYVGSEHLLLGLIGEPDGIGGSVLRSLGADLRVTRRTVAAALAGWAAGAAHQRPAFAEPPASRPTSTTEAAGSVTDTADASQLATAIRSELAPLLARIERLEVLTES